MEKTRTPTAPLVLIVEDDAFVRSLGADILEDAGFEVLQARDADEALRVLSTHPDIGVVFTDIEMPGSLDGLALAFRVSELWPEIGIVLTSGGRRIDPKALPLDGLFVPKPYAGPALLQRIADVMRRLHPGQGERRALSA